MDDSLWTQDLYILFKKDRLVEFYPTADMSIEEKVNSIVRFLIYAGLLTSYFKKDLKPIAICSILIFIVSFLFYPNMNKIGNMVPARGTTSDEVSLNDVHEISQNPYNNPLAMQDPSEYGEYRTKPVIRTKTSREAETFKDLFLVNKNDGNDRSFYTVPDINIPNNRKEYMEFMYGNTASHKDWFN